MAIVIDEAQGLFTLVTKNTMYQMKADRFGVLLHTYYGRRTPVCNYSYRLTYENRGFSGNINDVGEDLTYSLDYLPQEYPAYGSGDHRMDALRVRFADGASACDLRYAGFEVTAGKYAIPGLPALYETENVSCDSLHLILEDTRKQLRVTLLYGVMEELDIITRSVRVENIGTAPLHLEKVMSACLDSLTGEYDFMTFHGRHAAERMPQRIPLHHGTQSVGSNRGASSHQYNPFCILCEPDTTEDFGSCWGLSLLYSGDFLAAAELSQYDETRVLLGIGADNFRWKLEPGTVFDAPEAAMAYSDHGLTRLSQLYHRAYRHNLCRGKFKTARRPVLLNSWEGVYFDFDGEKLLNMASEAAQMGVELFVVDDGWFGQRDDDRSSLGDWTPNEKKLGCTMGELSCQIHDLGLKFGIWFEPECISEKSQLYRAHPNWAIQIPGKAPTRNRHELVLDYSRQEVRDNIFNQICHVLDNAQVEYVKWDFNRGLDDLFSASLPADRQGEVAHRFVLGLYDLLDKILTRYPELMIEGCSGGGGRFDAGMLYYTPQIWCSDNTDPIERLLIQYGTSFGYPISTVGAHVSKSPNEVTGRYTPIETRAVTAMAGSFGYELDVNHMAQEEKDTVREQIQRFHRDYDLIQNGLYYRLTDPRDCLDNHAWEFVSEDGTQALVNVVVMHIQQNAPSRLLKLKGLKPDALYRLEDKILPGAAWMEGGIPIPRGGEYTSCSWRLEQVDEPKL